MTTDEKSNQARRFMVRGRVQGVGFRYSAAHRAWELGLTGWVRNLPDGAVEVKAQGPKGKVETFLDYLGAGPPAARVSKVEVSPLAWAPGEQRFDIL